MTAAFAAAPGAVYATPSPERVLIVVSGHGQSRGATRPGYDFEEFARAYTIFTAHGVAVDVASPRGGPVETDEYDPKDELQRAVLEDPAASAKLARTLAGGEVEPDRYAAVFVVGGKGAMFDLPHASDIHSAIARIYDSGGVVSAVCHGPAALVNVKLSSGRFLVEGKTVNGFTNLEESLFGKRWAAEFEFMLEDRLRARGGTFESGPFMLEHVATDGRLITGQNPTSTDGVVEAVLRQLGRTPKPRSESPKTASLALIARLLRDEAGAAGAYAKSPDRFHGPLIAMYGYSYAKVAEGAPALRHALALMEMVPEVKDKKQIRLAVAEVYEKLGDRTTAKRVLEQLLAQAPEFEPAQEMLN
ncbi:MAG: type 1 glutamine amidotransferase domain-containing protein, partial [Myxococcota bacterium]